jgi:hypothetical protein
MMEHNPIEDNPRLFWLGLVLVFAGLVAAFLYLFGPHFWIFGPGTRTKHGIAALLVAAAGVVLASFARPRSSSISSAQRIER